MTYRNKKLTDLARDKPCMLRIPGVCNGNWATTVWCHSNHLADGRGHAHKAHDCFGCFGCAACHHWLDHGGAPRAEKDEAFERAFRLTLLFMWSNELIMVARWGERA